MANNLDLNISDIKKQNPYDKEVGGDNTPTINPDLVKVMPWLGGGSGVNETANRNIPLFAGDKVPEDFGESQYDKDIPWMQLQNESLSNIRSEKQPWYDMLANSLVKFGVITGTTFADNFVGTGVGLLNMLTLPGDYDENINFFENVGNKFFNNPYSENVTLGLQDWANDNFPIYKSDEYTKNQEEGNWHKNLGATWLLDNLPQMGFTAGTILSGAVQSGMFQRLLKTGAQRDLIRNYANQLAKTEAYAGKSATDIEKAILKENLSGLPQELNKAVNSLKTSGAITNGASLATSTFGEARVEAINSAKDFTSKQLENLNSYESLSNLFKEASYEIQNKGIKIDDPSFEKLANDLAMQKYQEAEQRIKSEAKGVAAMDGALNIPILTASNAIAFGRVFSRGFGTQRGFLNELTNATKAALSGESSGVLPGVNRIAKIGADYVVKGNTGAVAKAVANTIKPILSEGVWEEMMQGAVSKGSQSYGASQLNSFLGFKLDPDADNELKSRLDGILSGIEQTYTDWKNYEEGAVGGLFGGLGSISVRPSSNNGGFRPSWEGGFKEAINEYKEENSALNDVVNQLNTRTQDPSFKNYYQGIVRHNSLQNEKDKALELNDEFSFKNADHAQFISDIMMFEKAGRLQDLNDVIDNAISSTEVSNPLDVDAKAEEIKQLSKDNNTNIDMYQGKTNEEIVKESNQFARGLKSKLNDYRETSTKLKELYGDTFSGNSLEEMTYYFSQIKDWENRFSEVHEDVKNKLQPYLNILNSLNPESKDILDINQILNSSPHELLSIITSEQGSKELNESFNKAQKDLLQNSLERNEQQEKIDNKEGNRGKNKMIDKLNRLTKTIEKNKELITKFPDIVTKVNDLSRIGNARKNFIDRYTMFLHNPALLEEGLNNQVNAAINDTEKIENKKLIDKLKSSTNLLDFRTLYNQDDYKDKSKIVDRMSIKDNEDFNQLAVDFKKVNEFGNWYLDKSSELQLAEVEHSPDITNAVVKTLNDKINKSESFDHLLDSNNINTNLINTLNKEDGSNFNEEEKNTIYNIVDKILKEYINNNNLGQSLNKTFTPSTPINKINNKSSVNTEDNFTNGNIIDNKQLIKENNKTKSQIDNLTDGKVININKAINWESGVHEIEISKYKESNLLESRTDERYKDAANYIESKGGFNYINNGKLKEGDKVFFVIDPDYINLNEWTKENRPLLLGTKNSNDEVQIVGTFTKMYNYPLYNKIIEEYDKLSDKEKNKIFDTSESITTTVTNILPGRLGFNNEKNLLELTSNNKLISPYDDKRIIFGVANSVGAIETNTQDIILTPTGNTNFENSGRLYIGIKNAKGDFIPVPLRIKRFDEVDISNTEFGKKLDNSLLLLVNSSLTGNDEIFSKQVEQLRNFLYIGGNSNYKLHLRSRTNGNETNVSVVVNYKEFNTGIDKFSEIPISTITRDIIDGQVVENVQSQEVEDIISSFKSLFNDIKVPFQINKKSINSRWNVDNSKLYNNILLDANILTTNLQIPYIRGAYFYINSLNDTDFKPIIPISNVSKVENTLLNTNDNITGREIKFNDSNFIIDDKGNIYSGNKLIDDPNIIKSINNIDYINNLSNEEKENKKVILYDSTYYVLNDNIVVGNNGIIVYNTTRLYNSIMNEYNKKNNTSTDDIDPLIAKFRKRENKDFQEAKNAENNITPNKNKQEVLNIINSLNEKDRNNRTTTYRDKKLIVLHDNTVYNLTDNNIVDKNTAHSRFAIEEYNKFLQQNEEINRIDEIKSNKKNVLTLKEFVRPLHGLYFSSKNKGSLINESDRSNAKFQVFDINGNKGKVIYVGNISVNIDFLSDISKYTNDPYKYEGGRKTYNITPGEVTLIDGKWKITKEIELGFNIHEYNNLLSLNNQLNEPQIEQQRPVRKSKLTEKMFDTNDDPLIGNFNINTLDDITQADEIRKAKDQQDKDCPQVWEL